MEMDHRFVDAWNAFNHTELEVGVENETVAGVHVWRLMRAQVFSTYLESKNIFRAGDNEKYTPAGRLALSVRAIFRSITRLPSIGRVDDTGIKSVVAQYGPFWSAVLSALSRSVSRLAFPVSYLTTLRAIRSSAPRNVLIARFSRKFADRYHLTDVLEAHFAGNTLIVGKQSLLSIRPYMLELRHLQKLAHPRSSVRLSSEDEDLLGDIASRVEYAFGISAGTFASVARGKIEDFLRLEQFYGEILERRRVNFVVLCWFPHYFPLLSAAKRRDIKVIEIQHGAITRYHNNYSWPDRDSVAYFPDEIWMFGEYWKREIEKQNNATLRLAGSPHLWNIHKELSGTLKDPACVLVVSQKIVGIDLFKFVVEVARLRSDLRFVFKLHPAERYGDLTVYVEGEVPENVQVVPGTANTYSLMAKASYQLGVSSTTLQEGVVFENQIFVVPLPSHEYLRSMVENGHATMVPTPSLAAEAIGKFTRNQLDKTHYFASSAAMDGLLSKYC